MNLLLDSQNSQTENKENTIQNQPQHQKFSVRHEEHQYLDQIKHVVLNGTTKSDRTGVGTRSVFGAYSRYSLRDSNDSTYLIEKRTN